MFSSINCYQWGLVSSDAPSQPFYQRYARLTAADCVDAWS